MNCPNTYMNTSRPKPNAEKLGWEITNQRYLAQTKWFCVHQDSITLPDKKQLTYSYVEHPGAVFVVPVTSQQEIILIRSYRYTSDNWFWEVPAGTLADRTGMPLEKVAQEELREEIGGTASKIEKLGSYFQGKGHAKTLVHYYLAHSVAIEKPTAHETGEIIDRIQAVPIPEVKNMIINQKIQDGDSAFAIFLALARLGL